MHNIFDPNTKFNKVYMFLGNTFTVVSGIFALISWIISLITNMLSNSHPVIYTIATYVLHFCVVTFILGLVCLLSRIIYTCFKTKSEAFYLQRKLTEFIHKNLIHIVRNNIVELEVISAKSQKFLKENNTEAISELYNSGLKTLKKNLKTYVDNLSLYLSKYRSTTISVCIKVFKNRDRNRNEFQSEEIIVLARSTNTESERNSNKKNFIGQNTDFTNLCKGQIVFFGSSNLKKLNGSGQYINDSENWETDKYTSTLVTPIRYYNNNFDSEHNKNVRPDTIGFLCIDSKDEIKEWENSDSFELQLMATFSDILYIYIKEFYACFEKTGII